MNELSALVRLFHDAAERYPDFVMDEHGCFYDDQQAAAGEFRRLVELVVGQMEVMGHEFHGDYTMDKWVQFLWEREPFLTPCRSLTPVSRNEDRVPLPGFPPGFERPIPDDHGVMRRVFRESAIKLEIWSASRTILPPKADGEPQCDGPEPPFWFRWRGERHRMQPVPWNLLSETWRYDSRKETEVALAVWGEDSDNLSSGAIKAAVNRLNEALAKAGCSRTLHRAAGYFEWSE